MKITCLLLISFVFFSACSKTKKICREKKDPYIEAPSVVYERDTFQLNVHNVEGDNEFTADYWWLFPEKSDNPFASSPYGTSVFKSDALWNIYSANVRDEGTYTFTFNSKHCGDLRASKYIEVIPLPCPCFDDIDDNTLMILDSASGTHQLIQCTVNYNSFVGLLVRFGVGNNEYLLIDFDKMPEKTSTYYLRNYAEYYYESQIPYNPLEEAFISFSPGYGAPNEFRLIAFTEDVYVKREGNHITLTLCDLKFKSPMYGVKYVHAKLVLDI